MQSLAPASTSACLSPRFPFLNGGKCNLSLLLEKLSLKRFHDQLSFLRFTATKTSGLQLSILHSAALEEYSKKPIGSCAVPFVWVILWWVRRVFLKPRKWLISLSPTWFLIAFKKHHVFMINMLL